VFNKAERFEKQFVRDYWSAVDKLVRSNDTQGVVIPREDFLHWHNLAVRRAYKNVLDKGYQLGGVDGLDESLWIEAAGRYSIPAWEAPASMSIKRVESGPAAGTVAVPNRASVVAMDERIYSELIRQLREQASFVCISAGFRNAHIETVTNAGVVEALKPGRDEYKWVLALLCRGFTLTPDPEFSETATARSAGMDWYSVVGQVEDLAAVLDEEGQGAAAEPLRDLTAALAKRMKTERTYSVMLEGYVSAEEHKKRQS
jgi:hypothetical protein